MRDNSIDNRQSISIAWGRQGHKGSVRGPRSSSDDPGRFLDKSHIPLANIKQFFYSLNHQTSRSRITKFPWTFIAAEAAQNAIIFYTCQSEVS